MDRSRERDPGIRLRAEGKQLRVAIESLGGAVIKIGQQMSLRVDILPHEYCDELEGLLDERTDYIDGDTAEQIIEEELGEPLWRVFQSLDLSNPVGSASIACVFQGYLLNGDHVAVKVKRPGIDADFETDLRALDWVSRTLEILTIIPTGISENFRQETRKILMEELDFRQEARYQELFRKYYAEREELQTTAPKIYYHLSDMRIIVSEFVTGVWLKDVLAAVEHGDLTRLAYLRRMGISVERVAKLLIRGSYYGLMECPFFHGDPHPANILVQSGNRIVFVDFGACGVFSFRQRSLLLEMLYYQEEEDIAGMVRTVVSLMEPLPPHIDDDRFTKELEEVWWLGFYGIKSDHAAWWERTSFRLWLGLLRLVGEYQIAMPLHMLRMIRATLLYDTVAARLYSGINVFDEHRAYMRMRGKSARAETNEAIIRQLLLGPSRNNYLRVQRLFRVSNQLLFKAEQLLGTPDLGFAALTNQFGRFLGVAARAIRAFTLGAILFVGMGIVRVGIAQDDVLWSLPARMRSDLRTAMVTQGPSWMEALAIAWFLVAVMLAIKYSRELIQVFGDKTR